MRELLTTAQKTAIADIVAESVALEFWVDSSTALVEAAEQQAPPATHKPPRLLKRKIDALKERAIPLIGSEEKRAELIGILCKLQQLATERRTAIHGQWQPKGGYRLADLLSRQPVPLEEVVFGTRGAEHRLPTGRVELLADEIKASTKALIAFFSDFPFLH